jgi:catechol 2,3-dioxygenase-like lactoylglutathione lyase family enzyme
MTSPATALGVTPLFLVADVVKAAEHYRDRFGFKILNYYGDPPCFVFVRRGFVDIMLKLAVSPEQVRPNGAHDVWDAYVRVDDLDALRAELAARGTKIVKESPTTFYQMREIEVHDRDGYRVCFAQDVSEGA